MSVRDGERYLRATLASIGAQTFEDLEILVIDDGSTDTTPAILRDWGDRRLRVLRRQGIGLTAALADGMREARAPYVARIDADDEARPDRIARQVALLDADPEVGLVGSWADIVDGHGALLEHARTPPDDAAIRAQLLWDNAFFHSSLMLRAATIARAGGYDPAVLRAQDYDLAWRVGRIAKLGNIPEALIRWRRWEGAISSHARAEQRASAARSALRALREELGEIDVAWFQRVRTLWDGDRATLERGDARRLAGIVARLPAAASRTVWVELVALAAAARPLEARALLGAASLALPGARLITPKRVARIALGTPGIRAARALRRRMRGY